ncbi:metal ABC transporter solute-binding protein, Zn/Mn family [Amycolatopsis sp. YIM 10]|uniref:metal ABC transporter solute-binding protein, Zn/Mn family n=1 Tax=Amycolatopsis sp. YIM 10 TaxID=2653857 RepID=UPI00128FDC9D|nr:zinc ABC transporter substrate-binding protein [Amycolatopsis sp. YIM 10]QFU85778.1 Manganese ABC transporter substrate-binding lipoprotein precursor [Amycolatopsis sp. YIM 10]
MTSRRPYRLAVTTAAVAALAFGAVACGNGEQAATENGKVPVVVSTNVWGSVVNAIGGDKVSVKAIIDDPSGDPHSYQSTPEDAADVTAAKLLVANGGGYDEFFTQMADQAPDARKVNAFDVSGHAAEAGQEPGHAEPAAPSAAEPGHEESGHAEPGHGEPGHEGEAGHQEPGHESHEHGEVNEHVWYDLPTVSKVADQVATQLGELQPADAATFTANATRFKGQLDELTKQAEQIGTAHPDRKVVATEPIAHYLLDTAKVADATPPEFAKAIEEESEVPAAAQDAMNQLVTGKQVNAVINNAQTTTPVTEQLVNTAKGAGVPVVDVTETLPAGVTDYIAWMTQEVNDLAAALGK